MTEDKLLECPFCGSNDVYRIRGDPVQRCRECGASGPWRKEYGWNSRVFPAWLREKIEQLKIDNPFDDIHDMDLNYGYDYAINDVISLTPEDK